MSYDETYEYPTECLTYQNEFTKKIKLLASLLSIHPNEQCMKSFRFWLSFAMKETIHSNHLQQFWAFRRGEKFNDLLSVSDFAGFLCLIRDSVFLKIDLALNRNLIKLREGLGDGRRGVLRFPNAVPQVRWASNSPPPYGHKAMGQLQCLLLYLDLC